MSLHNLLNTTQSSELNLIKSAAMEIWNAPIHRHYTDHKPESHSERIIEKLDRLVENLDSQLNPVEAYILLAAAYLHDIGMQNSSTEWRTEGEIRENHHLISQRMIIGSVTSPPTSRSLNLNREFAEEIALVAAAHRRLDLASDEFEDRPKGGVLLRLRLLSALLRLADALDMDYRRVIMDNLSHESVNQISRLHWWRCHYVEAIDIRDGRITARLALPSEDYTYYLKASIEDEISAEVNKLQPFLWPHVKLSVAESPQPRISLTQLPMSPEDFEVLRRQVLQQREQDSVKALARIVDLREREERIAQETAQEGQRLSGSDPPQARLFLRRAANLFHNLGQPQLVASQLGLVAEISEKMEDFEEAAQVSEELGLIWMELDDPFRAKWAFDKAVNLTPDSSETANEEQIRIANDNIWRRQSLEAQACLLWGEFLPVDKWLADTENECVGNTVPLNRAALFFDTLLQSHILQNRWKEGLEVARLIVLQFIPHVDLQERVSRFSNASIVASYAGDHQQARTWIQSAFEIYSQLSQQNLSILIDLHSRRGLVQMRAGQLEEAENDFRVAWETSEIVGDPLSIVAQFDNLIDVVKQRGFNWPKHAIAGTHHERMCDLAKNVGRPGEEAHLKLTMEGNETSTLSALLVASIRAIQVNDFYSWKEIRKSLARIYRRANRSSEACYLWMVAHENDELTKELKTFAELQPKVAGSLTAKLVVDLATSTNELRSVAHGVVITADLIPQNQIEAVIVKLLAYAESVCETVDIEATATQDSLNVDDNLLQPRGALMPLMDLIPALEALAPQMSDEQSQRTALVAKRALYAVPPGGRLVREAAGRLLCELRNNIPHEQQEEIVNRLHELAEECGAFWRVIAFALEPHLVEPIRQYVRTWILDQAEQGDVVAAHMVLNSGWGPLSNSGARALVQAQIAALSKVVEAASRDEKPQFSSDDQPDGNRALVGLQHLLCAPYMNEDDAFHLIKGLLIIGNHPANMPIGRQVAIGTLGSLSESVARWQNMGWVDQDCISQVINTFEQMAMDLQMSQSQSQLAAGAIDILNPFRIQMGKIESLKIDAITSIGRWAKLVDGEALNHIVLLLLKLSGRAEDWMRRAAIIALKHVGLSAPQHLQGRVRRQIEIALHDALEGVQSAATWALPTFASEISTEDAPFFVQRLNVLSFSPSKEVRSNVLNVLRQLAELPNFASQLEIISQQILLTLQDASFAVRSEAQCFLNELNTAEEGQLEAI